MRIVHRRQHLCELMGGSGIGLGDPLIVLTTPRERAHDSGS
jgi:hypothetical protein